MPALGGPRGAYQLTARYLEAGALDEPALSHPGNTLYLSELTGMQTCTHAYIRIRSIFLSSQAGLPSTAYTPSLRVCLCVCPF